MKGLKNIYFVLTVMIVLMIAGFYVLFQKFSALESAVSADNQSGDQVSQGTSTAVTSTNSGQSTGTASTSAAAATSSPAQGSPVSVNASILFNASSSPDLQPQANLTILVSKVTKTTDGNIAVTVKVFTDSASSYSAVDLSGLIQIFNPSGNNQAATSITGAFKAMPPQNSVDGIVNFAMAPSTTSFILEVGSSDNPSFYQFDFNAGNYKQITVG